MADPDRITRAEAAELLGVSMSRLADYARSQRLRRHRNTITGRVTYERAQVEELAREREGS